MIYVQKYRVVQNLPWRRNPAPLRALTAYVAGCPSPQKTAPKSAETVKRRSNDERSRRRAQKKQASLPRTCAKNARCAAGTLATNCRLQRKRGQLPPHHAGRDTVQASNTSGASAMVATMTALMVCRRFSASSKAMLRGDSKTSSLTSMHSMPKR